MYEELPYYLHCLVGIAILVAGAIYWVIWAKIAPKIGNYKLVREVEVEADGWGRGVFRRIPRNELVHGGDSNVGKIVVG